MIKQFDITDKQFNELASLLGYCPYDIKQCKALGNDMIKNDIKKLIKNVGEILNNETT